MVCFEAIAGLAGQPVVVSQVYTLEKGGEHRWKLTSLLSRVASAEGLGAGEGGCGEHHSRGGGQLGEHDAGGF